MPAKHARKGTNVVTEEEDDDLPVDIDAQRAKIARRLSMLVSDQLRRSRSCAELACKRARACRAPKGLCSNPKPRNKPLSERHFARSRATLVRMLESMEQADRESQQPVKPDRTHKKS